MHSPEHRALCDLLLAARRKADLTQQDLAKKLKRSQSFVDKVEGGQLDVLEFVDFARAIEADPIKILRQILDRRT